MCCVYVCVGGEYASRHRNACLRFINLCGRMLQIPSSHSSSSVKAHYELFTNDVLFGMNNFTVIMILTVHTNTHDIL